MMISEFPWFRSLFLGLTLSLYAVGSVSPVVAAVMSPTQTVKDTIHVVFAVLTDPAYTGASKTPARQSRIKELVSARFDYEEMAKRTLAKHWQARSSKEQQEFIRLLEELIMATYLTTVESRTDEKVAYLNERIVREFAEVTTNIVTKTGSVAVAYRLIHKTGQWKVYDVVIADVSMVNNFRQQFHRIISSQSYQALVEQLRLKTANPDPS